MAPPGIIRWRMHTRGRRRTISAGRGDVDVVCHRPFDDAETVALRDEVTLHAAALRREARLSLSTR